MSNAYEILMGIKKNDDNAYNKIPNISKPKNNVTFKIKPNKRKLKLIGALLPKSSNDNQQPEQPNVPQVIQQHNIPHAGGLQIPIPIRQHHNLHQEPSEKEYVYLDEINNKYPDLEESKYQSYIHNPQDVYY